MRISYWSSDVCSSDLMWDAVFASKKKVNNVLVTSFNEWMAIKYANDSGEVYFVDVYNHEFSRDIEMMKGGYHDNFYMQLVQNVRRFKFGDKTGKQQPDTATYTDFAGDALPRDFANATGTGKYIDQSNRNDITEVKVTHDIKNLYFTIKTVAGSTPYNGTDLNWMNILIRSRGKEDFAGSHYIVNRKPKSRTTSIEKSLGGYNWTTCGKAKYTVNDNLMQLTIPLANLGLSATDFEIEFKVADHVTKYDDIKIGRAHV